MRNKPLWPFVLNRASSQARDLVGWWPMSAGRGSLAIDLSDKKNHGTLTNFGATATSGWTGGYQGGSALAFDGSNDFVTCSPAVQSWPFTFAGWANTTNTGATATMFSLCRTGTTNSWARLVMSGGAGAQVFNVGSSTGSQQDGTASGNLSNNVWYHIAATLDASFNWKTYRNGVQSGSGTFSSFSWNAITATAIGALRFSTDIQTWPGRLEDWKLYNRVLSAAEIYSLWHPSTRWQLRYQTGQRVYSIPAGGSPTAYTLTAATGSFALTGQDAGLRATRTLAAGAGTFTETGNAAGLYRGLKTAADAGVFTLTGQAAGLSATRTIAAAGGSFTVSGHAAGLLSGRRVTADVGSFALAGMAASLRLWRLAAGAGSFAVTGQSATLTYSGGATGNAYYYQTFTSLGA